MTRLVIPLSVVVLMAMSAARAQEPLPATPPQSEVSPPAEPLPPVDAPVVSPQWTSERQTQNQQGTVTNTHRYWDAPEEGRYVREHLVTNPRGEMTQSWERVTTEDGYQYRRSQTWANPDGTPLRQHERTVSGSDPYNYTREHSITLPDGRTINQTQVRTWDGTAGTMERSFTGPNGQTHQSSRSWTPDGQPSGTTPVITEPGQPSTVSTIAATSQPPEQASWWQKVNPFRKRGNDTARSATASPPRRGFTIGTPNRSARASSLRPAEHPSVQGSQTSHRPSWAGGAPRSMSPQGPPSHVNGNATASRPNPGRGPNR